MGQGTTVIGKYVPNPPLVLRGRDLTPFEIIAGPVIPASPAQQDTRGTTLLKLAPKTLIVRPEVLTQLRISVKSNFPAQPLAPTGIHITVPRDFATFLLTLYALLPGTTILR